MCSAKNLRLLGLSIDKKRKNGYCDVRFYGVDSKGSENPSLYIQLVLNTQHYYA